MLLLPRPTTPGWQRHQALPPDRFRLIPFRSPLLRESLLLSSPRGTQMFQFPRFPPLALCVHTRVTPHDGCGVPPFGHPRIEARSAAPRGFSQPPTSFIGIRRQGIHRWLFIAWKHKNTYSSRCSCSLSNSQGAKVAAGHVAGRDECSRTSAPPGRPRGGPGRCCVPSKRNRGGTNPPTSTSSETNQQSPATNTTSRPTNERSTRECTRHDDNTSTRHTVSSLERR